MPNSGADVLVEQLDSQEAESIFASAIAVMALRTAIRRALDVVASGRTFLLDVVVAP